MSSDVSVDNIVNLLEYVSLCDSYINNDTSNQTLHKHTNNIDPKNTLDKIDTISTTLSDNTEDSDILLHENSDTNRASEEETFCTNSICSSTISTLEKKVKLLETQNSQLIVNTCSIYNTLMKHIESLSEEIKKRDEIINKM